MVSLFREAFMAVALTPAEVAALVEVEEGRVRKDVEHGLFAGPRFSLPALVYFRTVVLLGVQIGVEDRRRLLVLIEDAMRKRSIPLRIELSPITEVKVGDVAKEMQHRLDRFTRWKAKLVENPEILGGEPVFPKTRTAVRRIGELLLRGVPQAQVREDYPHLKQEDLDLAKLYAKAYPRLGRPREALP
jgi:uncharacterized protein (DUF433 family)